MNKLVSQKYGMDAFFALNRGVHSKVELKSALFEHSNFCSSSKNDINDTMYYPELAPKINKNEMR